MKKILYGLLLVIVLVIAAVVIVPFFIPKETYVAQIQSAVRDATGRDLTIGGDISFSVIPDLALEVNDVAFSNAAGADAANMATLDQLALKLKLGELLSGSVAVDTFVLTRPVINLEIDAKGRPNWAFGGIGDTAAPAATSGGDGAGATSGPADLDDLQVKLGDVRLVDATITYTDKVTGTSERIDKVNMELSLPSLDDPFGATGGLVWNNEQIDIDLGTGPLRQLAKGAESKVTAGITAAPVSLGFDGTVQIASAPKAGGTLDLDVPSIRNLAAWARNPLPADAGGSGLGPLKITGTVGVDGKKYSFTNAQIDIDAIKSKGDLVADLSGKKPNVVAKMDVETLDMNPYLPQDQGGGSTGSGGGGTASGGGAAAQPQDWSDEPIDLSGLHQANAQLDLTVAGIRVQDIKIGRGALGVTLKDGLLNADLQELNLYEGLITGKVTVDARKDTPSIANAVKLTGVQALPLLTDAAGFDRLEGQGNADISVTASGKSQKQMVRNLNGNGGFEFRDGAIIGINIGAMIRNVGSAFLDSGATERVKTDFAELSGTYKITNGVLANNDLTMLAPLFRLSGKGTADINNKTANYRLEPKLVGSTTGQGGDAGAKGLAVPIKVTGPWHDLSYTPDLIPDVDKARELIEGAGKEALEGAAKDVEGTVKGLGSGAVENVTKDVDKNLGGAVKNLLGGGSSSGSDSSGQQEQQPSGGGLLSDPAKKLKGLFD